MLGASILETNLSRVGTLAMIMSLWKKMEYLTMEKMVAAPIAGASTD
jgi:hypothetical protein